MAAPGVFLGGIEAKHPSFLGGVLSTHHAAQRRTLQPISPGAGDAAARLPRSWGRCSPSPPELGTLQPVSPGAGDAAARLPRSWGRCSPSPQELGTLQPVSPGAGDAAARLPRSWGRCSPSPQELGTLQPVSPGAGDAAGCLRVVTPGHCSFPRRSWTEGHRSRPTGPSSRAPRGGILLGLRAPEPAVQGVGNKYFLVSKTDGNSCGVMCVPHAQPRHLRL